LAYAENFRIKKRLHALTEKKKNRTRNGKENSTIEDSEEPFGIDVIRTKRTRGKLGGPGEWSEKDRGGMMRKPESKDKRKPTREALPKQRAVYLSTDKGDRLERKT